MTSTFNNNQTSEVFLIGIISLLNLY